VSGSPLEVLNQLDGYLRQQGYARVGPAVRNRNMPLNGVVGYRVDGRAGFCYTVIGLASEGTDLNLFVLDPAGRTIAYNVNVDSHPWATFCPAQDGAMTARVQMVRGSGEYYYAVYQGSPAQRPDLTALFTGQTEQGPQVASIDPATAQRLAALDQRLAASHFRRIGEPSGERMTAGDDRERDLNLQQGTCYAFATLGGPGTSDTDVFLVDGSGNELQSDAETNLDAVVQYCAPQTGAYRLRSRLYEGDGPVFVAAYMQQGNSATATAVDGAQNLIAARSSAGAGLDENYRLLEADIRARGYEPFGEPSRGRLDEGGERDFSIELEGGKCYAILAVGDNSVRDLDLILLDERGRQIDRDVEADPRPIVRVCASRTGSYTMKVRMYTGQGNFVYAPYRWPRGTRGPFGLNGLMYVRLAEMNALAEADGYQPDSNIMPGRGTLRREGQSRSHNIQLQSGKCYAVVAVGDEGLSNLDLSLSQGETSIATDTTRTAFPEVRHCASESGTYKIKVEAGAGSGSYFYQFFQRGG
jgi:hypothetical protein